MREFFFPSSVVVIGVSSRQFNLGKEITKNLFEFRFTGEIHLVGPHGGIMFGRKIYKSVDEIPEPVELAVVLTPARTVPEIMEQCGRKGIRRMIIESGGFGEFDDQGKNLGDELLRIAGKHGIRFIGPNCIGIMNSSNGLATPFAALQNVVPRGGAGIIAQSGGVALSFLNMFDSEQLGFSKFATIGNKLNVDENDLLEYYVEDPDTSVICLYLESIKDGRRLTNVGRRSSKPILVHKANIGPLSRVVAQSHTEALANDDMVVDAALRQAGMVRFRDMQSYLDFIKIQQLPRMKGRNLAIVSRSGGHAVIAADAAYTHGFMLPPFSSEFLEEIRKHLRADVIRLANPLDLGDLFDFDVYIRIIEHTLQQDNVDGILFLHTYFAGIEGESSRRLLQTAAALSQKHGKPCALCVSSEHFEISRLHKDFDFPIFMSPEQAVQALDLSLKYQHRRAFIRSNSEIMAPAPSPDDTMITEVIRRALEQSRAPLLDEALDILRLAGIDVPDYRVIAGAESVEERLAGLAGPYAVKIVAAEISHKSDVGGVALGLPDARAVREACDEMARRVGPLSGTRPHGFVVQQMVPRTPGSYELIVGGKRDRQFGPMVLLGHGGIFVEVFGKVSLRMAPLSPGEIEEMITDLPGSEIFRGVRGKPPVDTNALKDAILRVAHLMVNFPEIDQIDVNPIVASPRGSVALDARIVLQ